jgi:hypothetical protein
MASPGLALSGFTNLDQEFAPEYQNSLTGSAPGNSTAGSDVQPLPIGTPHDTVTLSNPGSEPDQYQSLRTTAAASFPSAAHYPTVRDKASISPVLSERNSERSQSSTKESADARASSTPKAPPKLEAVPSETEAPQEDSYQATTQTAQQSLLQLDRTLQQIGVDPQHTSLVRRVALVRLANDPPALGEYFGPPSAVAATTSNFHAETRSPAPEPATPTPTTDTVNAPSEPLHRSFLPEGKLLNVIA